MAPERNALEHRSFTRRIKCITWRLAYKDSKVLLFKAKIRFGEVVALV